MPRPSHYEDYDDLTEVSPGVFVDPGHAVYIVDDEGEVFCSVNTEWAEEPEAVTAALNAVALAVRHGAAAVRRNIVGRGALLLEMVEQTFRETHPDLS